MHEKFDQTDGETRPRIDRRETRRVPALPIKASPLAGPNRVRARDDAPQTKHPRLDRQAVFKGVKNAFDPTRAEVGLGCVKGAPTVQFRVRRGHEFARFRLRA